MVTGLVISYLLITTASAGVSTDLQGMMFLYRFGYITEKDMTHISSMEDKNTKDMMVEALREFQERSGLAITGALDDETMKEMSLPRCGVKDVIPLGREEQPSENLRRAKRYVLGSTRWWQTSLTYRFPRTRNGNQARPEYQQEMDRAFRTWMSVSPLDFRRVTNPRQNVDINIRFASGSHGDNSNFDGPSGANGPVLGHAFYPNPGIGGDIHFDDEENWVTNKTGGVDFFAVALHELGHSIGLDHSTVRDAIMYPSYTGYRPNVGLHSDDIAGVRAHYGRPPARTPSRSGPRGSSTAGAPSLCGLGRLDAAFQDPNSQDIYIFSGNQSYLLQDGMSGKTTQGYPQAISTEFPGVNVVQQVDAALAWPDGHIFIFERDTVWKLKDGALQANFPQPISEVFPGIPNGLSAACFWPRDQLTYFFKGDQYWRYYNTNAVNGGPRSIRRWRGVSGPVDAVLSLGSDTYFFQDNNHYRYSNRNLRVYPDYPKSTKSTLFGCSSSITSSDEEEDSSLIMTAEASCLEGARNSSGRSVHPSYLLVTIPLFIITALGCES